MSATSSCKASGGMEESSSIPSHFAGWCLGKIHQTNNLSYSQCYGVIPRFGVVPYPAPAGFEGQKKATLIARWFSYKTLSGFNRMVVILQQSWWHRSLEAYHTFLMYILHHFAASKLGGVLPNLYLKWFVYVCLYEHSFKLGWDLYHRACGLQHIANLFGHC